MNWSKLFSLEESQLLGLVIRIKKSKEVLGSLPDSKNLGQIKKMVCHS